MKNWTKVWGAACLVTALAGAGMTAESMPLDGIVAYVNEHVVTMGDLRILAYGRSRQLARQYSGTELEKKLRATYRNVLDMVVEKLLILDAYKRQKNQLPEWYFDQRLDGIIRDMFGDDRTRFHDALVRERMTRGEWRERAKEEIVRSFMYQMHVAQSVRVSPVEVRRTYDKDQDKYRNPEEVDVSRIALKRDNAKAAQDIMARLRAGEAFAKLAKELSKGMHASKGGALGWQALAALRLEEARSLSQLKPGDVSEPTPVGPMLCVLKLHGRRGGGAATFDEARPRIERMLKLKAEKALYEAWIDRLQEDAHVEKTKKL